MLEHLPEDIRSALQTRRPHPTAPRRRLALHLNDAVFPILRLWDDGLALAADRVPKLRGFVEIHDGPRHLMSCLIVASEVVGNELLCSFKRTAPPRDHAALDYATETGADPALRLPHPDLHQIDPDADTTPGR